MVTPCTVAVTYPVVELGETCASAFDALCDVSGADSSFGITTELSSAVVFAL